MLAVEPMSTGDAIVLGVVLIVAAIVLFEVGRRSIAGTLKRNWVVGIRVPATMESDASWEAAHRAAGRLLQIGAIGPLVAGVVAFLRPSGTVALVVIFGGIAWLLVFVLWSGIRARKVLDGVQDG